MILSKLTGPTGFPGGLRIVSVNSSFIKFRWNKLECNKQNGPLIGYQYKVCTVHKCLDGMIDSKETSCILHFEHRDSNKCTISIAAVNEVGIGDYSPNVSVTNLDSSVEYFQDDLETNDDLTFESQIASKC